MIWKLNEIAVAIVSAGASIKMDEMIDTMGSLKDYRPKLTDLLNNLFSGNFGKMLLQGYPNIDLIAPADIFSINDANPGLTIEDYLKIDTGTLSLQGRPVELDGEGLTTYLADPLLFKNPDKQMVQTLLAGTKYSSPSAFLDSYDGTALTVPIIRKTIGGGMSQSARSIGELIEVDKKIYALTNLGPGEEEIRKGLEQNANVISIPSDIHTRVNWVVPYAKEIDGQTVFDNRIIIKHPFTELTVAHADYLAAIKDTLTTDHGKRNTLDTIFINGSKSRQDLRNALDYSLEQNGTHLVTVLTDTTAGLGRIVMQELVHHSTYISNNDEIGILCKEKTSKINSGYYTVKLEDTLHAIRKLREVQRKEGSYQNIYVTLGDYGSISIDKEGHVHWVGIYGSNWSNSPDTTGFGDTFAAGIGMAENVDKDIPPVIAQIFSSAMVAAKKSDPEYKLTKEGVEHMIEYNHIPTLYLGQFDQNNSIGNLRQGRIQRLSKWLETDALVQRK